MLLHELDGLQVLDQSFMGEKGGSVPRDIHLYDEHAGNKLFDRNAFCRHKASAPGRKRLGTDVPTEGWIHGHYRNTTHRT